MYRLTALLAVLCAFAGTVPAVATAASNGGLPRSALSQIYVPGNTAYLADGPAAAWNTMRNCSIAGSVDIYPGPSRWTPAATAYRSYAIQVTLRRELGSNAAIPGNSNHGWGGAIDLASQTMRSWIDRHGESWGWAKKWSDASWEWWHLAYRSGVWPTGPNPGLSQRYPLIREGSRSKCLRAAITEAERRLGLSQDGSFSRADVHALRIWKDRHGLRVTSGIDEATWKALRSERGTGPVVKPPDQTEQPAAGADVKAAQGLLNVRLREAGSPARLSTDGVYGPATTAAVCALQGLRAIAVDCRLGEATWTELRTAVRRATGPDVSEHQGSIDWPKVRSAGHDVAFLKASEGQDFRDHTFSRARLEAIRAAHLAPSPYHFLRPRSGRAGAVEADWFVRVLRGAGYPRSGDLRPVADLEVSRLSAASTCAYAESFDRRVRRSLGVHAIFYTYPAYSRSYLSGCSYLARRTSWLAGYGVSWAYPVTPWRAWTVWQHTDRGSAPGINGPVDLDVLPGGRRALDRLRVP